MKLKYQKSVSSKCVLSKQLSACIKSRRINKDLSQEQLAELVGISRYSVMRYESGEREPTFSVLIKICDVLGMKFEDFITEEVEK